MVFSISLRVVRIKCANRELGLSMYTFVAHKQVKLHEQLKKDA